MYLDTSKLTIAPLAIRAAIEDALEVLGMRIGASLTAAELSQVEEELKRRDILWVLSGLTPTVSFADEKLKTIIMKMRPHELITAQRLTQRGYPFHFQYDYRHYYDKQKGYWQTVGLADDGFGKELKWVSSKSVQCCISCEQCYW